MRTRDVRPWWWWINPWLYIKRRDTAYDDALDTLYELCTSVEFHGAPYPCRIFNPGIVKTTMKCVAGRCRDCGKQYIQGIVEDNA